ncbi:MAG TPA: zinc ribbon domain-containing protein [Phycisphaerae bacterium]|nr:zinc ribbon domain-containing protein [Phycisphaerae bacterium]HRY70416.1 zinc ribbon domain-containing protein [Phycisphaerae bacterium]
MSLGIRKLIVFGSVASVFLLANMLLLAHWLDRVEAIGWANWLRQEFLTGTALTVILALLVLLMPARQVTTAGGQTGRRCPACDGSIARQAKYCGECGSRV